MADPLKPSDAQVNPFEEIQNSLDLIEPGYKIQMDPTQADRAIVTSPKGQTLNVNLRPAERHGPVGKVWTMPTESGLQGKAILPELTGIFPEDTGDVEFTGKTSSQQIAHIFNQGAELAARRKTDWKREVNNLVSKGNKKLGISPAPSVDFRNAPATQAMTTGQIALNIKSSSASQIAYRDQSMQVIERMQRMIALGSQSKVPVDPIRVSSSEKDVGGSEFTFQNIAKAKMIPGDKGQLIPNATQSLPTALQIEGKWRSPKDFVRASKAPKLGIGVSDEVKPYKASANGIEAVVPKVTTNTSKPQHAYANVLAPGETEARAKDRAWFAYGKSPIAGTAFTYEVPKEERYSFWGKESQKNAPIEGVSVFDLLDETTKINVHEKLKGRRLGGGVPVTEIGTLTRNGKDPEPIKARMGPSTFRPTKFEGYVPNYIDKKTGKPAEVTTKDLDENGNLITGDKARIMSTESLLPDLEKAQGIPFRRQGGEGMGITTYGQLSAGLSLKENDTKAGLTFTGKQQPLKVGGKTVPLKFFTGEAKGPGILSGFFEGLSYKQLNGLLKDYAKTGAAGSPEMLKEFQTLYKERGDAGQVLNVNMEHLGNVLNTAGGDVDSAQELQARIFENTIMAPLNRETGQVDTKANRRNMQRYGAAVATGKEEVSLGAWHPEQLAWQKENYAREYSELHPKAKQEEIDASFNSFFKYKENKDTGYYDVSQRLSAGDVIMNKLYSLRMENVHNSGAGWEWMSGLSEKFPNFARQMGAHVEAFTPKGETQQSALGLLKYGVWQGQRREDYTYGEGMDMPEKDSYQEISGEQLGSIANFLEGEKGNENTLDILDRLNKGHFADLDKNKILYNPETKTFIPNPYSIQGSTFKELGVESAVTARPYLQLLSNLGQIASPFNELSAEEKQSAAMDASQGMYNYTTQMISGGGDFMKNLFSQMMPTGFGGRTSFDPTLAPNQMYLSKDMWEVVGRRMGVKGNKLAEFVEFAQNSGVQGVESRYPMLTQQAINAITMQTKEERIAALGNKSYQAIENNPLNRGNIGVSGVWGQVNVGDWDRDPVLGVLGFSRNKKTGEVKLVQDPDVQKGQVTRESANQIEKNFFRNQSFSNMINSGPKQMLDYVKNKDVMKNILGGVGAYRAYEAVGYGVNTWLSKTLGMGIGYNPRRAVYGGMAAGGYSQEETAKVLETVPSFYQPALDKMLKGRIAAGAPAASLISLAYAGMQKDVDPKTGKETETPYIHLGATGEGTERTNTISPVGTALANIKSPGMTLGVEELFKNPNEIMAGSSFMIDKFARGADVGNKPGEVNAGLDAEQTARWFALPGEAKELAKRLTGEKSTWAANLMAYQTGIINRAGGAGTGIEAILGTPIWRSIMTRLGSKGLNNLDPFTLDEEGQVVENGAPGGQRAFNQIMGNTSPLYQMQTKASIAIHDIAHKAKTGLRGITADMLNQAAQALPKDQVIGQGMMRMAKLLGVPTGPSKKDEIKDDEAIDRMLGPDGFAHSNVQQMRNELGGTRPKGRTAPRPMPKALEGRPVSQSASVSKMTKAMEKDDYRVLDLETTGKGPNARIIQVGITDSKGNVIMDKKVRPPEGTEMEEGAFKAHGITLESLKNEAQWAEIGPQVMDAIKGYNVLGFNIEKFDAPQLQREEELSAAEMGHDVADFKTAANYVDVMQPARRMGWAKEGGRLVDVAHAMGIGTEGAHDAVADVEMTRQVAQRLQAQAKTGTEEYQKALIEAGPLSNEEFRDMQNLKQQLDEPNASWKFNVLQERFNKFGREDPRNAKATEEPKRTQKPVTEQQIAADLTPTKPIEPTPAPQDQPATASHMRGRTRTAIRTRRGNPPTPPAGTSRVQQEQPEEERIRWMQGMSEDVALSMKPEDAKRMASLMGIGGSVQSQQPAQTTPVAPQQQPARQRVDRDPNQTNQLPGDQVAIQNKRKSGVALRVGHQVRGFALHIAQQMRQEPMVPQINQILTERFGFSGEATPADVGKRMAMIMAEKGDEFLAALPPELRTRMESMKAVQAEREYVRGFTDIAPGLDDDIGWIRAVTESALRTDEPGIGQDIQTFAPFLSALGTKSPKTGNLRSARGLARAKEVKSLDAQLRGAGLYAADSYGPEQFTQIKQALAQGKRSHEEIAIEKGFDPQNLTDDQKKEVEQTRSREITYAESLRRVSKLPEAAANRAGLGEMRTLGKEFISMEGSAAVSPKKGYVQASTDELDKLSKSLETFQTRTKDAAEAVNKVSDKEQKRLDLLKEQARLDFREEALKFSSKANQSRINELTSKIASAKETGGAVDISDTEELTRRLNAQPKIDKAMGEVATERSELGEEKWGSAARRMIGGFGLMYLKSIGNFATSGLGYGMEQRQAFDAAGAQGSLQYTGQAKIPYNQQNVMATSQALYGVNNNPIQAMQTNLAQRPIERDIYNVGAAGLGVWGYTQFAAGQIGGKAGAALAGAAMPLAMAAGSGAMALDVMGRQKDEQGLAYRMGTGKGGLNDLFAAAFMPQSRLGGYLGQEEMARQFHMAAQAGAPVENLMEMGNSTWEANTTKFNPETFKMETVGQGKYKSSQADAFYLLQREVADRYQNYSTEAQTATAGYLTRAGGSVTDKKLDSIINDIEMGGWAQKTGMGAAQVIGYRPEQVYGKEGAQMQQFFADQQLKEGEKATLSAGFERVAQLPGFSKIPGMGARGGSPLSDDDLTRLQKAVKNIGDLSDASFDVVRNRMQLVEMQQQAGTRSTGVSANELEWWTSQARMMNPEQQAQANMQTQAKMSTVQRRMGIQQQWQSSMTQLGETELGQDVSKFIGGIPDAKMWKAQRLLSGDPMLMQMLAKDQPGIFDQLQGPTTIQGTQLSPNTLATADVDLNGRLTGLGQYRSSFTQGSEDAQQVSNRIFGADMQDNRYVQAATKGVVLPNGGITLSSGQQIGTKDNPLAGTQGAQWQQNMDQYAYQMAQIAQQRKGMEQDYAYQMQMWGLQDQQRNLGHGHQMTMFGYQQEGMDLSRQSAEQQNQFFNQNMAMQQYQTGLQRSWTKQDWGINAQTRQMQWGWQQDDFQEERRFMTGRQRRLAEKQQDRAGIMHNLEDEQINRQQKRQETLWKLEDERFEVQKEQHAAAYEMQKKNFDLQQKQFDEQKKFYLENKKIEDQIIALQREHWLEQHSLAEEQLALTEKHAQQQLELQQYTDVLNTAMENEKGLLNTLAEDSMVKFTESIMNLADVMAEFVGGDVNQLQSGITGNVNPYISPGGSASSYVSGYTPPQITGAIIANNASSANGTTSTDPLAQYYSNYYSHAIGGNVWQGGAFPVGENGPEMFVPAQSGEIYSNTDLKNMLSGMESGKFQSGQVGEEVISSPARSSQASKPAIINVYIGNERLETFIVDTVGGQF